uniref:Putative terminase n=1 Tax=viral metagenome TaxID=1070528 RepID=A0A6M3J1B3_9ZZZZ
MHPDPDKLRIVDPWYWAYSTPIKLIAGAFSLPGHEFQVEMMQLNPRRECMMKATQMVGTETHILKTLHGLIHKRYPLGALCLFPTGEDVSDFSSSRWSPLIKDNPYSIGRYVKDTNRTNLKRIGGAFLFFRGARLTQIVDDQKKSASKLKSIPVDKVIFDEVDEMSPEAIPLAQGRMKHSNVKEEVYLANPTIPDFGIDKIYNSSDQRVWMIKCEKCGKETCLELEFPECLLRTSDNRVIRVCRHCRNEIFPRNGRWVPLYPARTQDMVGRWISHLNSAFVDPKEILDAYENPNTTKDSFYNLQLGMAYIDAENRLTKNQVYACCGLEPMQHGCSMQCALGVDVGKHLHVVIGYKINEYTARIVKVARVSSFNDVHDLAKQYNVRTAVFDLYPEERKVREFQKNEEFDVFGCDYLEDQRGPARWDYKNGLVRINRTEICDSSHTFVSDLDKLELPRKSAEIEQYAQEMINTAKVLQEDKETGKRVYRYKKLGPDHYRHATNYFLLALEKVGVSLAADEEEYYHDRQATGTEGRSHATGY